MDKILLSGLALGFLILASPVAGMDQRGIYLYTEHPENKSDQANLVDAMTVPGVDGVTVLVGWQFVEPAYRVFAWDLNCVNCKNTLDDLIAAAIASGKKIDLAVRAGGQDTPAWLFQPISQNGAGATPLTFYNSPLEGNANANCNQLTMAAPWDNAFLGEWDYMLQRLSQHLKDEGYYDAVTSVRLTGINRTTAELRLPAEILKGVNGKGCPQSGAFNDVETWLEAPVPYRPSTLLRAWDAITDMFQKYFPDKFFTLPIIPSGSAQGREYPFPPIDENGCPYAPPWPTDPNDPNFFPTDCVNTNSIPAAFPPNPDQNAPLLDLASRKFAGRLSVAYQNLDLRDPAQPYVIYAADKWRTLPGFQTNDYINFQQAACPVASTDPFTKPCDDTTYLQLLNLGIYPCLTNPNLCRKNKNMQSQYIEVLPPDAFDENSKMPTYNNDIETAHSELLTPPWIEFQFPALPLDTAGWRNSLPVTGTVIARMDTTVAPYDIQNLTCAGAAQSNSAGLNSPTASADLTVATEGRHVISCSAVSSNPDQTANRSKFALLLLIDTKPPVTTASVVPFQTGNLNAAKITLSATDNLSGVAETQYRIDGGAWTAGTVFTIESLGKHAVQFRSSDLAGNVESTKSITVAVTLIVPPCHGKTCV